MQRVNHVSRLARERRSHKALLAACWCALFSMQLLGCGRPRSHDVAVSSASPSKTANETPSHEQERSVASTETTDAERTDDQDGQDDQAADQGGKVSSGTAGASAAAGSGGTEPRVPRVPGKGGATAPQSNAGMGGTAPENGNSESNASGELSLAGLDKPKQIQTGTSFSLAESPLWDHCSHQLLFVDVTASVIYSLSTDDALAVYARDTHNTNGIAFAPDGSLILAQMQRPGHIARLDKSGQITTLTLSGPALHTPDDLTVRSDGTIYFSDGEFPPIGGVNLGQLPVYGVAPGASMLEKGGTVAGPNGLELSPDERTLYVDAYFEGSVVPFAVAPDGKLTKGKALATGLTNPDSLCLDAAGNLYVAVSAGLQVLRPDGTRVGLISVRSTQGTTNCAFGGEDGKTLYITTWTGLWKLQNMPIAGLEWQVNRARFDCQ